MADQFTLEITYKGESRSFEGELRQVGYLHKIYIQVNGMEVIFEPDEERNYRAVIPADQDPDKMDKDLLYAIIRELETFLK